MLNAIPLRHCFNQFVQEVGSTVTDQYLGHSELNDHVLMQERRSGHSIRYLHIFGSAHFVR